MTKKAVSKEKLENKREPKETSDLSSVVRIHKLEELRAEMNKTSDDAGKAFRASWIYAILRKDFALLELLEEQIIFYRDSDHPGFKSLLLDLSTQNHNLDVLRFLIEDRRIDFTKVELHSNTMIIASVRGKAESITQLLLKNGYDPNVKHPSGGMTALHMAVWIGLTGLIPILIENGAKIFQDHSGNTPLHLAAIMNNLASKGFGNRSITVKSTEESLKYLEKCASPKVKNLKNASKQTAEAIKQCTAKGKLVFPIPSISLEIEVSNEQLTIYDIAQVIYHKAILATDIQHFEYIEGAIAHLKLIIEKVKGNNSNNILGMLHNLNGALVNRDENTKKYIFEKAQHNNYYSLLSILYSQEGIKNLEEGEYFESLNFFEQAAIFYGKAGILKKDELISILYDIVISKCYLGQVHDIEGILEASIKYKEYIDNPRFSYQFTLLQNAFASQAFLFYMGKTIEETSDNNTVLGYKDFFMDRLKRIIDNSRLIFEYRLEFWPTNMLFEKIATATISYVFLKKTTEGIKFLKKLETFYRKHSILDRAKDIPHLHYGTFVIMEQEGFNNESNVKLDMLREKYPTNICNKLSHCLRAYNAITCGDHQEGIRCLKVVLKYAAMLKEAEIGIIGNMIEKLETFPPIGISSPVMNFPQLHHIKTLVETIDYRNELTTRIYQYKLSKYSISRNSDGNITLSSDLPDATSISWVTKSGCVVHSTDETVYELLPHVFVGISDKVAGKLDSPILAKCINALKKGVVTRALGKNGIKFVNGIPELKINGDTRLLATAYEDPEGNIYYDFNKIVNHSRFKNFVQKEHKGSQFELLLGYTEYYDNWNIDVDTYDDYS